MKIIINNWNKYNARRDVKSTTWLRLNNDFCTNPKLFKFSCEERMVFIYLLCEASKDMKEEVEVDYDLIAALLRVDAELVEKAVVKLSKGDNPLLSFAEHADVTCPNEKKISTSEDVTTRTNERTNERDEHNEQDKGNSDELVPIQIFNLWNQILCDLGSPLSMAKALSDKRKKSIKACIKAYPEMRTVTDWENYFRKIHHSGFLLGHNKKGWKADFDWIINKNNMLKIIEGRYDVIGEKSESQKIQDMANRENPYDE